MTTNNVDENELCRLKEECEKIIKKYSNICSSDKYGGFPLMSMKYADVKVQVNLSKKNEKDTAEEGETTEEIKEQNKKIYLLTKINYLKKQGFGSSHFNFNCHDHTLQQIQSAYDSLLWEHHFKTTGMK